MKRAGFVGLAVAGAALLLGSAAATAAEDEGPELWRWVDAEGIVRYTPDRGHIPLTRRGDAERVSGDMPELPREAYRSPEAPPPVFRPPMGEVLEGEAPPPERAAESDGDGSGAAAAPAPARARGEPPAGAGDSARTLPPDEPPSGSGQARARPTPELDARIAELEAEIDRAESAVKDMLQSPATPGKPTLAENAELREVTRRLPALYEELARLREERERASGR